jgi:hypothetical protein
MQGIINHYPPVLKQIKEMQQIARAEDAEFEKLKKQISEVIQNMFIFTANEAGISRFERIIGITPKAAQSLDERKAYIFYMMNRRKMSLSELNALLSGYSKNIELKPIYSNNELVVLIDDVAGSLEMVYEILDSLLPLDTCITMQIPVKGSADIYTGIRLAGSRKKIKTEVKNYGME